MNQRMYASRRKQCDLSPGESCLWGPYWYDDNGSLRKDPHREKCGRCKTVRLKKYR